MSFNNTLFNRKIKNDAKISLIYDKYYILKWKRLKF